MHIIGKHRIRISRQHRQLEVGGMHVVTSEGEIGLEERCFGC